MGKRTVTLLLLILAAACNTFATMPPEREIPELYRLRVISDNLPNKQGLVEVEGGYRIAYRYTSGAAARGRRDLASR